MDSKKDMFFRDMFFFLATKNTHVETKRQEEKREEKLKTDLTTLLVSLGSTEQDNKTVFT